MLNKRKIMAWVMWLMTMSFFTFQFVIRFTPGNIMGELMSFYQIDATRFGILSAIYYLGYAGFQIPIGILLDRYPLRIIVCCSLIMTALSNYAIAATTNWHIILVCRFLIGISGVAGFLSVTQIIKRHFPAKDYTMLVGLSYTIGFLGAVYSNKPVIYLLDNFGWENVIFIESITCIILSFLIFVFVREKEVKFDKVSFDSIINDVLAALKQPKIVLLGLSGGFMLGIMDGFADIWGVFYLMKTYGINRNDAVFASSMIFMGISIGAIIIAYFAQKFSFHRQLIIICGILMAVLFSVVLIYSPMNYWLMVIIMFMLGFFTAYQVLIFSIAGYYSKPNLSAVTTAIINTLNMAFGFIFHSLIGFLLDLNWKGQVINNLKIYDNNAYKISLFVIVLGHIIGTMIIWISKPDNPKN